MSENTDNYINLLKPFSLTDDEARLYLYLVQSSPDTALNISRSIALSRTKVYRLLDNLQSKQLVEFQLDDRGMKFSATNPNKLIQIANNLEAQVTTLRKNLDTLLPKLEQLQSKTQSGSKILYYKCLSGLKQVTWNSLKAKDKLRVYEVEHASYFLPVDYAEKYRQELVNHKITALDLTNNPEWSEYTKITKMIKKFSLIRYINSNKLRINSEALIYNDVYAVYTYKDHDIFIAEIHNQDIANMQKQLFDFIWNQAQPMKYINDFGAAALA